MTKAEKKAKLEEEMKALQAKLAECEDSEEEDEEEEDEEEEGTKDAEEEEEEKKNLLQTVLEVTGEKTYGKALIKLALRLSRAHTSTVSNRADLVSAAIKAGKLEPALKGMAMRVSEKDFANMLKGMGGTKALKLGKVHHAPERTEETPQGDEPTAAELKSGKAMGLSVEQIKAARKQTMIYGKADQ